MEPTIEEKPKKRLNLNLWSRETDKKIIRALRGLGLFIVVITIFISSVIVIGATIYVGFFEEDYGYEEDYYEEDYLLSFSDMDCNVAGIEAHGFLITYIPNEDLDEAGYPIVDEIASESINASIQDAEESANIKAIILEVDSYGGFPVAAEEVANALRRAKKPTVVLIREGAVSAAYWVATGADIIFASRNSDVGSIGITMSYLDYSGQNIKDGIKYISLSSGKFKDAGDPDKPLSAEERELFMRDVKILHQNFIEAVSENRGLDIEKVRQLADGSTMLGQMALENGLIDQIGGEYEVKEYLKEKIGEEVEICW